MRYIAYRAWINAKNPGKINRNKLYYVAQVAGDGGADWGYVTEYDQATPLNESQAKQFRADCRATGYDAQFLAAREA